MGHPVYDNIPHPPPWDNGRGYPPPATQPYRPAPDDTADLARIPPLTDSGVHRIMLGTAVRVHCGNGQHVDVGLLTIRNVSTWADLVQMVTEGRTLEVLAPTPMVIVGWSVARVEILPDDAAS